MNLCTHALHTNFIYLTLLISKPFGNVKKKFHYRGLQRYNSRKKNRGLTLNITVILFKFRFQ